MSEYSKTCIVEGCNMPVDVYNDEVDKCLRCRLRETRPNCDHFTRIDEIMASGIPYCEDKEFKLFSDKERCINCDKGEVKMVENFSRAI